MTTNNNLSSSVTLGIITGSGPEAGLDLWAKVLLRNQHHLGPSFSGDLDAPRVVILSEPSLGLSMDLRTNETVVWDSLRRTVEQIAPQVDAFAIACNTLNWYAPQIEALGLSCEFVSFQSVLRDYIAQTGCPQLGLLGAQPVVELGHYSAYRCLEEIVALETPADHDSLHALIHDVKRLGSTDDSLRPRLAEIIATMQADDILLACTELPLISSPVEGKRLIDVTDLVADSLARRSVAGRNT
jgi:aspartate racemase